MTKRERQGVALKIILDWRPGSYEERWKTY